jgi:hypothetical protein
VPMMCSNLISTSLHMKYFRLVNNINLYLQFTQPKKHSSPQRSLRQTYCRHGCDSIHKHGCHRSTSIGDNSCCDPYRSVLAASSSSSIFLLETISQYSHFSLQKTSFCFLPVFSVWCQLAVPICVHRPAVVLRRTPERSLEHLQTWIEKRSTLCYISGEWPVATATVPTPTGTSGSQ